MTLSTYRRYTNNCIYQNEFATKCQQTCSPARCIAGSIVFFVDSHYLCPVTLFTVVMIKQMPRTFKFSFEHCQTAHFLQIQNIHSIFSWLFTSFELVVYKLVQTYWRTSSIVNKQSTGLHKAFSGPAFAEAALVNKSETIS